MVPLFDGPFKHHHPDVPEEDRDRAVTPERDIVTICVNKAFDILIRTAARRDPGGFYFGRNRLQSKHKKRDFSLQ